MQDLTHSQNFLTNIKLVTRLVKEAGIKPNDIVVDIGAGRGDITEEISKYSRNVIAIEIDKYLFEKLQERFKENKNIDIVNIDFTNYTLPKKEFKVFSNIPFNQTAQILKKLMDSNMSCAYVVIQREASFKFGGQQLGKSNSMLSVINGVKYTFNTLHRFDRYDFYPIPNVDTVLLEIKRKENPLVNQSDSTKFSDFISYIFNKAKPDIGSLKDLFTFNQLVRFEKEIRLFKKLQPRDVSIDQFVYIFNFLLNNFPKKLDLTKGFGKRMKEEEKKIQKIHRTRKDIDWNIK